MGETPPPYDPTKDNQPEQSQAFLSQDNLQAETNEIEGLEARLEAARAHFLEIAATEGPDSEIAINAVGVYHDLLQMAAELKEDRDRWLCTEILNTYIAANEVNPRYQEMVVSSQEDLDMVQ